MNPLSILLADDDEGVRALFDLSLKRRGHRVTTVASGREALLQLASGTFDVLITDIVMPEVDGLDVIKAARKSLPLLRIIAVSGGGRYLNGKYCTDLAGNLGADVTLMKPILPDQLAQVVEETQPSAAR